MQPAARTACAHILARTAASDCRVRSEFCTERSRRPAERTACALLLASTAAGDCRVWSEFCTSTTNRTVFARYDPSIHNKPERVPCIKIDEMRSWNHSKRTAQKQKRWNMAIIYECDYYKTSLLAKKVRIPANFMQNGAFSLLRKPSDAACRADCMRAPSRAEPFAFPGLM